MRRNLRPSYVVCGFLVWLSAIIVFPPVVFAQASNSLDTQHRKGEAYRLFILGRYFERSGDLDSAIESYRNAASLDLETGEILAELSSLYARQNEPAEAIHAAKEALISQPDNLTAHRILGFVYAAQVDGLDEGSEISTLAIEHLEQARGSLLPDIQIELALARLYLGTDRSEDGIEVLEALLEDEMGLSEAAQLLSEAYEESGRIDDALVVIENVVASGRPSSRLLRRLGGLYGRASRWPEAIEAYESAVFLNPRGSGVLRELANALLQAGRLEEGRDVLSRLTATNPNDGAALYRLSEVERELGNFDAATIAAENLVRVEPRGIRGPYALAEVHLRRYDYASVIETLEPAVQIANENSLPANQVASLLGRLGFAYEQIRDFASAAGVYARAADLLPTSLGFGTRLVQTYLEAERLSDAREALDRIQLKHPGDLGLSALDARIVADGGSVNGGRDILLEVLSQKATNPMAHIALGSFFSDYERFGEAVDVLESALERFPRNSSVLFQLGAVMEQHGRFSDAEKAFREILDRDPQHSAALNYLGYMLADRGERLDESLGLLKRAIKIDPNNSAYLDSLGWAYYKLNRLELAETYLRQASEQMVWNSVIQDHLGDLLFRLGRYDEAIEAWERALDGDKAEVESSTLKQKIEDAMRRRDR